ncbi:MAG: SEC-C metal-binding domain-containing protein, partial [bacterium]
LMRIFGSDRMKRIMETLRVPDYMPIENKIVSRSIESAQKKVEGHHFDVRKHLVEYDDVINKHRETIYRKRREVLEIKDHQEAKAVIMQMVNEEIESVVSFHCPGEEPNNWNLQEVYETVKTIFTVEEKLLLELKQLLTRDEVIKHLSSLAEEKYEQLTARVEESVRGLDQQNEIKDPFLQIEKGMALRAIDNLWVDHLDAMDQMRTGIGLRGYGQRDPLVEYKKEAYNMFSRLLDAIRQQLVYSIYKLGVATNLAPSVMEKQDIKVSAPSKTMAKGGSIIEQEANQEAIKRENRGDAVKPKLKDDEGNKVGRNDLCPCGSNKKFKKCCGK